MQVAKDIEDVIDMWCPDHYKDAPQDARMLAALLEANSCVIMLRDISAGRDPLRPLDSFKPFHAGA